MRFAATCCLLFVSCVLAQDAHAGHDHSNPYDWAGIFETKAASHTFRVQEVNGKFKKDKMKIVLLASDSSAFGVLSSLTSEAKEQFAGTCKEVELGQTMTPKPDDHGHRRMLSGAGGCFELHLKDDHRRLSSVADADSSSSSSSSSRRRLADATFTIDTSKAPHLAIFTELAVTDFAPSTHYLTDAAGWSIYAKSQINAPPAKPWGVALGAACLVVLVTLTGVIFLVPFMRRAVEKHPKLFGAVFSAFAGGALLGATFFLLLFEATHLVPGGASEGASAAMWGSAIIVGYLTASLIDVAVAAMTAAPTETTPDGTRTADTVEKGSSDALEVQVVVSASKRARVIAGVLVGDFLHNLCDGIFIGTGFLACNATVGWSIATGTIFHEIAQEASDYLVLTNKDQGNLSVTKALILNVISGLSVVLGVIIVLVQNTVDNRAIGLLLAFGGGVYVQLGASECMPRAYALSDTTSLRLCTLAAFVFGATAIALVLFDHKHCSAAGGSMADAHAGHNH